MACCARRCRLPTHRQGPDRDGGACSGAVRLALSTTAPPSAVSVGLQGRDVVEGDGGRLTVSAGTSRVTVLCSCGP